MTLETGPAWKMQLLLGLLEEHGVLGFILDSGFNTAYSLPFPAHLKVPQDALEAARAVLAEHRATRLDGGLDEQVRKESADA